jgi:hypothetical protein
VEQSASAKRTDLRSHQGFSRALGPALLKDALLHTAQAADTIGARAVLAHAQDEDAKGFYAHFDFEPSPSDPYHLLLIMKKRLDIAAVSGLPRKIDVGVRRVNRGRLLSA